MQPRLRPSNHDEERPAVSQFEAAYQRLRREIIEGLHAPQQRLVEMEVAQMLGISRVTAHAVLIRLQEEGLVEIQPHRGARVRAFSLEEAMRILQVREVLEGLAAALAAEKATRVQIESLRAILVEMEDALGSGDLVRYSSLNGQFHRAVLDIADHEYVSRILATLRYPLGRYQFRTVLAPGRASQSLAEHREILRCIEQHDRAAADAAGRRHVEQVRSTLQEIGHVPAY